MKKIVATFLLLNLFVLPCYAEISDSFVQDSLSHNLTISKDKKTLIGDDFVNKSLDKNLKVNKVHKYQVNDFLVSDIVNVKQIVYKPVFIEDEYLPKVSLANLPRIVKKKYNGERKSIDIPVRIVSALSTKTQPEEGSYVYFESTAPVKVKNVIYPKGSKIKGRIETVSMNKSMGVPADLIVGNFTINNISLEGEIKKIGANRSLWVYPSVYAGCLFFGAGILLIPIRGGHAKIETNEIFTLHFDE